MKHYVIAGSRQPSKGRILIASIAGAAILSFGAAAFAATTQGRIEYTAAKERAAAAYKEAMVRCQPMTGHDRDLCAVDAKATEKRAKASAEASFKGTVKAKTDLEIARADADLMVAKVACDARAARERELCVTEAQATQVRIVSAARARKAAADAKADALADTREAQYKVMLARCDAMPGAEKDNCVTSAKSAHAK